MGIEDLCGENLTPEEAQFCSDVLWGEPVSVQSSHNFDTLRTPEGPNLNAVIAGVAPAALLIAVWGAIQYRRMQQRIGRWR